MDRSALSGPIDRRSDILSRDASAALGRERRVAFLPPDKCSTTSASPTGASTQSDLISMYCGVLMSQLETSVAQAGYEVVSWQVLRQGVSGANPIPEAKRLGVELIFEVNQLSIDDRRSGLIRSTGLEFFAQPDASTREPVEVGGATALRCKALVDAYLKQLNDQENLATIAIKAVEVSSGRSLWYYQNTLADQPPSGASSSGRYFFDVPYDEPKPPAQPMYNKAQENGAMFMGVGGMFIVATGIAALITLATKDEDEEVNTFVFPIVLGLGGLTFFGGLTGLLVGNSQMERANASRPELPLRYQAAEDVLCAAKPVIPSFQISAEPGDASAAPDRKSSYTFVDERQGGEDQRRVIQERLFQKISADFAAELQRIGQPKP